MANSENVKGPGNGIIPLAAVLLLTVLAWGGIWGLHKKWYIHPLNPIGPVEAPAAH